MPIITKCKLGDEDLDLDVIKDQFISIFEEDTKRIKDEEERNKQTAFYAALSEKLKIYDPLDRDFIDD